MRRAILIIAAAVAALTILWIGIGIGAASAVPAECSSAAGGRVECWDDGQLVIYTDQAHTTNWGDYIVVKREE